jgi:hypothetical protein
LFKNNPETCFDFSHPALERIKALYEEKKQLETIESRIENEKNI